MIPVIYPYKMGSKTAKALAEALNAKRVYPDGRYRPKGTHMIVNWGNSHGPTWEDVADYGAWLNASVPVSVAGNKLATFRALQEAGVSIPDFTTSWDEAGLMLERGDLVLCRHKLTGHSGEGIHLAGEGRGLEVAPLYVKYIKKKDEYRVHVFKGQVIDIQQKKKRRDSDEVDAKIRSHANGWVFCRDGISPPSNLGDVAIAAVQALGLDFGAVDIIHNTRKGLFVLEVNTAPGLEGQTLTKYVEAIKGVL